MTASLQTRFCPVNYTTPFRPMRQLLLEVKEAKRAKTERNFVRNCRDICYWAVFWYRFGPLICAATYVLFCFNQKCVFGRFGQAIAIAWTLRRRSCSLCRWRETPHVGRLCCRLTALLAESEYMNILFCSVRCFALRVGYIYVALISTIVSTIIV